MNNQGFLSKLKEYKEFILILVLFFSAASWMYGVFETKRNVRRAECLLGAQIAIVELNWKLVMLREAEDEALERILRPWEGMEAESGPQAGMRVVAVRKHTATEFHEIESERRKAEAELSRCGRQ